MTTDYFIHAAAWSLPARMLTAALTSREPA